MPDLKASAMNRRDIILGAASTAASLVMPHVGVAQQGDPPPPDLVAAANREGRVVFYTAVDLSVSEKLANVFMQRYPRIRIQVERTGAERVTQRVMQEYDSRIKAVDVVDSSDTTAMLD